MKRYGSLRWILLAAGVVAILGLTGMNVYSIYSLHQNTLESSRENKKLQISEFTDKIRYRFFKSYFGLSSMDIKRLQTKFQQSSQFTPEIKELLDDAAKDDIYKDIYFIPSDSDVCQKQNPVFSYSETQQRFIRTATYPEAVCDGMGIARTQMKTLISDYRYNNKVIFDTHRSITIALVNPSESSILGYLTMPLNQDYVRNVYLPNKLSEKFGTPDQSGMDVWLRDWTNNEVIASSDSTAAYDREMIQFEQNFPDFFDYWKLEVAFTDQSTIVSSRASLYKNLIVLGAAMLILLGALVFMFRSAQKERALAQQQAGFLANVTHELKTPLSVMQAAGENLADGRVTDPKRLKDYGSHIYNEAVRLRNMIEKLLDVAKADAGQSMIDPQPLNLAEKVESYIKEHGKFIRKKGFDLEVFIEEDLPLAKIDPDSFNTILNNLLENAVKYSKDDKFINIRLYSDNQRVVLEVEDHGVGMSKKVSTHIFDKFYRAGDTLTPQTKGHGLGLSIVKNLVDLNEGEIEVSSEPSKGSTFTVTFPILEEASIRSPQSISTSEAASESLNKESEPYVN